MFTITELPNGNVVTTVATVEEGIQFIDNIESFSGYKDLKKVYGDTHRVQQELIVSPQEL
jgi:hypothetical protein